MNANALLLEFYSMHLSVIPIERSFTLPPSQERRLLKCMLPLKSKCVTPKEKAGCTSDEYHKTLGAVPAWPFLVKAVGYKVHSDLSCLP